MYVLRLGKLLGDVVISQGGVVPFIQPEVRRRPPMLAPVETHSFHSLAPAKQNREGEEGQPGSLDSSFVWSLYFWLYPYDTYNLSSFASQPRLNLFSCRDMVTTAGTANVSEIIMMVQNVVIKYGICIEDDV